MTFRLWTAALILLIAAAAFPATDAEAFSGIYVRADDTEYDYDAQTFSADGNAFVRYNDITLTADRVTGNAKGDFEATGNVTFSQGERVVKGESFIFNYKTRIGHSTDASISADGIYFHGQSLDSTPQGYSMTGSTLTTCNREPPHYYLSARELIIRPGDKIVARHVRFVAFGTTLFTLPRYTVGLKEGRKTGMKLPSVGISGRYGTFLAHNLDVSSKPGLSGKLALRLSTKQAFQGGIKLDRVAGSPVFLNLTYREPYYGGLDPDTTVSRLPEVAYRFYGKGTPPIGGNRDDSLYLSRTVLDPTTEEGSGDRLNLVVEAGVGRFKEEPSGADCTRSDLRAMAWLDPMRLGDAIVMPGALTRLSHYSTGDNYMSLGFQLSVARKFGPKSYLSLAYITHAITGRTPFDFDPVEIPLELAGRLQFPLDEYAIGLGVRYDLQKSRVFDSEVSVSKVFHCIEPKLTWRNRFREFSISVGLVGF